MAIVKGPFQLSGSISNVSFYTRKDSDKVIMRTKGGVNGKKMKRYPQYQAFRDQQKEWSGCTKTASAIRQSFGSLLRLADYNLTPVLNALVNKIQKADTENIRGNRSVNLSAYKQALEGFNFNRNYPFNAVLRVATSCVLDRKQGCASVSFDRINPEFDLLNVKKLPYFRLIISLGLVSDMAVKDNINRYEAIVPEIHGGAITVYSEWMPTTTIAEPLTLTIEETELEQALESDRVTLILSAGISFGATGIDGKPEEQKYAGCGKVLKTT